MGLLEKTIGNEGNRIAFFACAVGLMIDLLCGGLKIYAGWTSGFISVLGDGFNNITDIGALILLMLTVYYISRPSDKSHPFGYGRLEYINSTLMSVVILYVGVTLFVESVNKIITPIPTYFSPIVIGALLFSVAGKIFLTWWYRQADKKLETSAFSAYSADSFSDILATSGVIVATVGEHFFSIHFDGVMGMIMSFMILYTGYSIMKGAMNSIIGTKPSSARYEKVRETILSVEGVYGVHDIIIHDYGSKSQFVSAHIELNSNVDFMKSHHISETVYKTLKSKLNVESVIHTDPKVVENPKEPFYRNDLEAALYRTNLPVTYHDFFFVERGKKVYLSFELLPARTLEISDEEVYRRVLAELQRINPVYDITMSVDHNFFNGPIYGVSPFFTKEEEVSEKTNKT